ncbi:MAG: hypothetical protein ACREVA_00675 [Burkholderiales bacterium]
MNRFKSGLFREADIRQLAGRAPVFDRTYLSLHASSFRSQALIGAAADGLQQLFTTIIGTEV